MTDLEIYKELNKLGYKMQGRPKDKNEDWHNLPPQILWLDHWEYRVKPDEVVSLHDMVNLGLIKPDEKKPTSYPKVNWKLIKTEYKYMATDGDGETFVFINKPEWKEEYEKWLGSGDDDCGMGVDALIEFEKGTCDPRDSLQQRPVRWFFGEDPVFPTDDHILDMGTSIHKELYQQIIKARDMMNNQRIDNNNRMMWPSIFDTPSPNISNLNNRGIVTTPYQFLPYSNETRGSSDD